MSYKTAWGEAVAERFKKPHRASEATGYTRLLRGCILAKMSGELLRGLKKKNNKNLPDIINFGSWEDPLKSGVFKILHS